MLKPEFVDYLIEAWDFLFKARLMEADANLILYAIGVVDVACGVLCMSRNSAKIFIHLALWGAATALVRYVAKGEAGIPQILLRAGHAGVPLYFTLKIMAGNAPKITFSPLMKKPIRGKA